MMERTFLVLDKDDGGVFQATLGEILSEINRDRSQGWTPYDVTDWQEGLSEWTTWEILAEIGTQKAEYNAYLDEVICNSYDITMDEVDKLPLSILYKLRRDAQEFCKIWG